MSFNCGYQNQISIVNVHLSTPQKSTGADAKKITILNPSQNDNGGDVLCEAQMAMEGNDDAILAKILVLEDERLKVVFQ